MGARKEGVDSILQHEHDNDMKCTTNVKLIGIETVCVVHQTQADLISVTFQPRTAKSVFCKEEATRLTLHSDVAGVNTCVASACDSVRAERLLTFTASLSVL